MNTTAQTTTAAAPAPALGNVASRAMICQFSSSTWTARKGDKKAAAKVTADAQSVSNAARVSKSLDAGNEEPLKRIRQLVTEARTIFYTYTMPWYYDGTGILPATLWQPLNTKMTDKALELGQAVDEFILIHYPAIKAAAPGNLGELYDEKDFPSGAELRRRFRLEWSIDPLPMADDFRVNIADDDADMIRADIEDRTTRKINEGIRQAWTRAFDAVQHMADTLPKYHTGETKKLYESVIGNVREIAEILPALNILRDPALDAIADQIKRELCNVSTEIVKVDPHAANTAADRAKNILATMSAHMAGGHIPAPAAPAPMQQPPQASIFSFFAAPVRS